MRWQIMIIFKLNVKRPSLPTAAGLTLQPQNLQSVIESSMGKNYQKKSLKHQRMFLIPERTLEFKQIN